MELVRFWAGFWSLRYLRRRLRLALVPTAGSWCRCSFLSSSFLSRALCWTVDQPRLVSFSVFWPPVEKSSEGRAAIFSSGKPAGVFVCLLVALFVCQRLLLPLVSLSSFERVVWAHSARAGLPPWWGPPLRAAVQTTPWERSSPRRAEASLSLQRSLMRPRALGEHLMEFEDPGKSLRSLRRWPCTSWSSAAFEGASACWPQAGPCSRPAWKQPPPRLPLHLRRGLWLRVEVDLGMTTEQVEMVIKGYVRLRTLWIWWGSNPGHLFVCTCSRHSPNAPRTWPHPPLQRQRCWQEIFCKTILRWDLCQKDLCKDNDYKRSM